MRVIYELTRQINDGLFTNYANEKQFSSFIKGDSLSVKVNGAIDRMDICAANDEKYVKVIDYKSSHRSIDFSDLYNGLSIQLPLYLSSLEMIKRSLRIMYVIRKMTTALIRLITMNTYY